MVSWFALRGLEPLPIELDGLLAIDQAYLEHAAAKLKEKSMNAGRSC